MMPTGLTDRATLLREGLKTLIRVESARRLAALGGSDPQASSVAYLGEDRAGSHPGVVQELALGSIEDRARVLTLLADLWRFPTLGHDEVLGLVDD